MSTATPQGRGVGPALLTPRWPASSLRFRGNLGKPIPWNHGAAYVNSAEMPPAVVPAADPADPADRVNPTDRADPAYRPRTRPLPRVPPGRPGHPARRSPRRAARHPGRHRPDDRGHRPGRPPAPGTARPSCPASGRHIHRLVRRSSLFCLRGNCYRDPLFAVGQPRRRADARLDAPGLGPDAVKVLEGELIQVLVGQAALGQRVHVGTGLADVAPGLAGGQRG